MKSADERLSQIEKRLEHLERLIIALRPSQAGDASKPATAVTPAMKIAGDSKQEEASPWLADQKDEGGRLLSITQILGWTGVTALVLAAAYLIRLAVDVGWLTPARQIGLAVIGGFSLIGTGWWLRSVDRQYASLLPASGLVVLFLSIYGAHLYYHLIVSQAAAVAVALVCIGSLWLSRKFESELFGLFSVVGSYSVPFLIESLSGSVIDLVIYYSAWSILFCVFSVWIGNRRTYFLAAYMALSGSIRYACPLCRARGTHGCCHTHF